MLESDPELYFTLSGTPQRRPLSWAWTRRPVVKRLSGTTSPPSTASRGVEQLISRVRASRALRSASPEQIRVTRIIARGVLRSILAHATGGGLNPTGSGFWQNADLEWCSLKTFQLGLLEDILPSSRTRYADWVTQCKTRSSSLRQALEQAINGSGFLSWQRTPAACDGEGGILDVHRGTNAQFRLRDFAAAWPTPNCYPDAPNMSKTRENGRIARRLTEQSLGKLSKTWPTPKATVCGDCPSERLRTTPDLPSNVSLWPTAAARDEKGPNGEAHRQTRERAHDDQLPNSAATWATPNANERGPETKASKAKRNAGGVDTQTQAMAWATPTASENANRNSTMPPSHGVSRGETTAGQVTSWATPTGTDAERRGEAKRQELTGHVQDYPPTHPDAMTIELGELLQKWTRPECPRLNPVFQWWLMGWPSPTQIYSASAATAWFQWQRQLHSEFYSLMQELGNS